MAPRSSPRATAVHFCVGVPGYAWLRRNASFFGTHAVLYSPEGRKRLGELAGSRPVDMQARAAARLPCDRHLMATRWPPNDRLMAIGCAQLDGMLAFYNSLGLLRVLIAPTGLAQQTMHTSDVQALVGRSGSAMVMRPR